MDYSVKKTQEKKGLEYKLRAHDWTYEYSDDHSVWTRGTSERKAIRELVEAQYQKGLDPADLFFKHYPKEGCNAPSYYGIKRTWEEQLEKRAMDLCPDLMQNIVKDVELNSLEINQSI